MRATRIATAAAAAVFVATTALAQPTVMLRSVRVGAVDVPKSAAFYRQVFGYQEISRVERPDLTEIIMNLGKDPETAKANTAPKLVVISRPAAQPEPTVSPLVFNTTDVAGVVARASAAGGKIERQPTKSQTSGSLIAFVVDPAGNRIEVIQPPAN